MISSIPHWIDGRRTPGSSGRRGPVYNPASGEQTGAVDLASTSEVDAAVTSARAAAHRWAASSLSARVEVLFALRELLHRRAGEAAALVTAEHGKVLADAAGEVARGLENVEFATGIPNLLRGGYSPQVSRGVDVCSLRQPLGVVAGITPFNFPVMVPLWMCANAIACGNAFVLKPSEKDPSPSLLLAELWQQAGLPDGVFSVVNGDREAVEALLGHPEIAAVSFVGSTPVARHVYETATAAGKRVQALGGAKNHLVVLPDADLEAAADAAVSAGYGSAGERCMAVSVVVAVGEVGDRLVDAIAARAADVVVGDGSLSGSQMGPLVTAEHAERVAGYVAAGEREGAEVVVDGRKAELPPRGFYLGPCLLDRVTPEMTVYRDEIFGPVLSVVRVGSLDEALALVNANPYGNGVALFTADGAAARRFQLEVEAGMVGINVAIPVPVAWYSFGGWKASLFGDAHIYGPEGVSFYTRGKVVTSRWPDRSSSASAVDLGFPRTR
jgi:malonate-semialdehyde dehydrogenase (acetylating)/methylmalonate-semialdehyde dehydrogenase